MLLINSIQTPDGTVLISRYNNHFVSHLDENGKRYWVDGGNDYARRSNQEDEEDLSVVDTGDHNIAREFLTWVSHDASCKEIPILLRDMDTMHIAAILEEVKEGTMPITPQYLRYMKEEIVLREVLSGLEALKDIGSRYHQRIYCVNCGTHDDVYIKKGVPKKGRSFKCRTCDCEVKL